MQDKTFLNSNIIIFNRKTKKLEKEKIYGKKVLLFLYKKNIFSKFFLYLISNFTLFSKIFALFKKKKFSKKKIYSFIKTFEIDKEEFTKKIEDFSSFRDFFIREIKKRKISNNPKEVIIPADGRYLVFPNINEADGFYVKGEKFNLYSFLKDKKLSEKYTNGAMAIGRLAPSDYHRFHFPVDCFATKEKIINGYLYSVNPIAIKKNIKIFEENKRILTILKSDIFKEILFIEIGATNVGSIIETFKGENFYKKGDEKGYFDLGGSSIVIIFEENIIKFEKDLIENSKNKIETKTLMGEILGKSI
ncbi:MAG: hypothetical protein AMS24_03650 [Chlamydiae bacterium SM23_39]|nr:MAG: hypothetical protein AMS24_03650 [Chlamydiae bacterium SM23_39]